jgi:tRNA A-37 threonylcarbamoyl transferase component Bud32
MMDGWVKVVKKLSRGHLKIFYRPGDEKRVNLAFSYWQGEITGLTRVKSSTDTIVHEGTVMAQSCYFKRYMMRGVSDRIKHIIRPSRARRDLINEEMIQSLGFYSPRSLCLIEECRAGFVRQSALITGAIKDAPSVSYWINQGFADSPELRQRFLKAFGHVAGAWHSKGLHHGDMRLGNILCRFLNGEFVFYWLDNERTKRYAILPLPRRVSNLVQVNMEPGLSPMDRMEFWKAYIEKNSLSTRQEKELMRKVILKTKKRWEKKGWIL